MSDSQTPAPMDVRPAKAAGARRFSFVWLVPLIALAISLGVAYQNYAARGTVIEISFEGANGIKAGETVIKYRDVDVGRVESVSFADGLGDVLITAEIDQEIAPYLDDDAQFWVVQPDVSLRGVTGLSTVLSGVYIEGTWDDEADVQQYAFTGLEEPPLIRQNQQGTLIVLRSRDGSSLADGAPILHKGIQVGYLETPRLAPDGQSVTVDAFIEAPFDRRVTTSTRFWDASGFTVTVGASGLAVNVGSLASLIEGGIAFDTIVSGGTPIRDGQIFDIFTDEDSARSSLFADPDRPVLNIAVLFDGSVNGLSRGSDVRFQGVRVGEVTDLAAVVVEDRGGPRVQLRTVLAIEPGRLGMNENATPDDALSLLQSFAQQGLRARLTTGNILSGALVVELVDVPNAAPAELDATAQPYALFPTTDNAITDVANRAEDVLTRINDLPIEELMQGAIDLMESVERLTNDESLRQVPVELTGLLADTRALVGSEDVQGVPADVRGAIADVNAQVATLIGDIQGLVGSDDVKAVPIEINALIGEMNAIVDEITQAQLADKLVATLDNANGLVANLDTATQGLPAITEELAALTSKANALELEALVAEATATLDSINALVGSESTQDIPASLSNALDEMALFLTEVREGGAINNVNAALASASQAAQAIETSVAGLPALSNRANALVAQTEAVIAGYGERSRFSAETLATLREVQAAADSISALARAIQRNPNSLLTGR